MNMIELSKLVIEWADAKGLKTSNPNAQFKKVYEEFGETSQAILLNDLPEIEDGIGDVFVTLIVLSNQLDIPFEFKGGKLLVTTSKDQEFINAAFCIGNIGHHINSESDYSKGFISHNTLMACEALSNLANSFNLSAEQCLGVSIQGD